MVQNFFWNPTGKSINMEFLPFSKTGTGSQAKLFKVGCKQHFSYIKIQTSLQTQKTGLLDRYSIGTVIFHHYIDYCASKIFGVGSHIFWPKNSKGQDDNRQMPAKIYGNPLNLVFMTRRANLKVELFYNCHTPKLFFFGT